MALLPAHLDRAFHAACGRISDDGLKPVVATIEDIESRMGDPPSRKVLQGWLVDLTKRGLLHRVKGGWSVTDAGWRAANMMEPTSEENDNVR